MDTDTLEKLMILSQRIDKVEFTLSDTKEALKNLTNTDLKEWKKSCENQVKEEIVKSYDLSKILIFVVILLSLTSGVLWYSVSTRISSIESFVSKESDFLKKLATRDEVDQKIQDAIRAHEKNLHLKSVGK